MTAALRSIPHRDPVRRALIFLALAPLVAYLLLCLVMVVAQERLVFIGGGEPWRTPDDFGLAFEELELKTTDGETLHGWWLPADQAQGAVLVCHGNAGSVADRLDLAQTFLGLGTSVLLFDYRGYGLSTGSTTEAGTALDSTSAFEELVRRSPGQAHVIYGESLGGAVAIELASRVDAQALITEASFTSLPDVGAEVYPFIPVRLLSRIRYESLQRIPELKIPKLFIHSPDDTLIPFAHMLALHEAAREPKHKLVTGGGHNDGGFLQKAEWRGVVKDFLDQLEAPTSIEEASQ